jgi:hypothetical protein
MDERVWPMWRARLRPALAALLPEAARTHPDAGWLMAPPELPADPDEARLARLAAALGLSPLEQAALALALWVELDERCAAALALLQAHGTQTTAASRPSLGLLSALAGQLGVAGGPMALLQGKALASGLLQLADDSALLHARSLRAAPALLGLLAADVEAAAEPWGQPLMLGRLGLQPLAATRWRLPRAWSAAAERLALALEYQQGGALLLRGADREEAQAFVAALGRAMCCQVLLLQDAETLAEPSPELLAGRAGPEGLRPALLLARALPLWRAPAAPGQVLRVPVLAGQALVVLAGPDSVFESDGPLQEFELPAPTAEDREALWQAMTHSQQQGGEAVARSRCGMAVLARAAALAADGPLTAAAAIEQALRASARGLSAWAQLSTDRIPADAWVGPVDVQRQLGLLLTRCMARAEVGAGLGPLLRGRLSPGVKALFIGASGTGKTLAAQWLADRLARPLVRVDLAAVVSKYIGETEKNLAQLLARAEHLDAVLLFDEADSLFGARTDVKQANDRYANMQTNYLLQRLESFHGVALLTSNSKARFDDAFMRRLDAVLEFALPDVGERRTLWALHLGEAQALLDPAFLNKVAALVDLPGGHIRNAVLTASLLARQHGAGLQAEDLREALALEYRKLGQRLPDSLDG